MVHLLLALALASNATGKTLVRVSQGRAVISQGMPGLIVEDAGTVSHVVWRGGGIVDSKGNAWQMQGTVAQLGRSGRTPPGATSFSDTNYYTVPSPNVFQFAGDFWACFVFRGPSVTGSYQTLGGAGGGSVGWIGTITSTNGFGAAYFGATGIITTTAVSVGVPNVLCVGRTGSTGYAKMNLGTLATGVGTVSAGTPAMDLGRSTGVPNQPFGGAMYEAIASTTSPGNSAAADAMFAAIQQLVKGKLLVTAW